MSNDILVLGKGFIGKRIAGKFRCTVSDARITSINDAEAVLNEHKPKIIINCIGYTGRRNIDQCEADKDKTLVSNMLVPIILAEVAMRNNIKMVHISSGCIYHYDYDKDKPIGEDKVPDFLDLYYSRTKIYAERILSVLADAYKILIVRIRIPLDNRPHPRNILTKLINYGKLIKLPNSITYIPDFIRALEHLIKKDAHGIYNIVNVGALKYRDLMDNYKKYVPDCKYEIIKYKELKLVRTNLILSTEKLQKTGFPVRNIYDILDECVREYVKGR